MLSLTAIRDFKLGEIEKNSLERLDAESHSHKRFDIGRDCKNTA
jgi:hypothetical protein